jgi:hypothetical protein
MSFGERCRIVVNRQDEILGPVTVNRVKHWTGVGTGRTDNDNIDGVQASVERVQAAGGGE